MKALSLTLGATALTQATSVAPSFVGGFGPQFQQVSTATPYQQYSPNALGANSYQGQGQLLGVSYSPFNANKPWQQGQQGQQGQQHGGSTPSNWVSSPPSEWTSPQGQGAPAQARGAAPVNPALAGRSPSEQLQITKCRSAQSCEKCRQLNCYWDVNSKVTNRCIALGLESAQVPVEAGEASKLGYCPTSGQPGFVGVNWLAIENSGVAVPNLEGMSDANVQQWLSSLTNYNPDATDSNYPAGVAFRELLPSASSAYAAGKIPNTTPWVSFFDSYLNGGYNYDGYYDMGYSYDSPSGAFMGGNSFGGSFDAGFGSFPSTTSFAPATTYSGVSGSFGSPIGGSFGGIVGSPYSSFPAALPASPYSSLPTLPGSIYSSLPSSPFPSLPGSFPSSGGFSYPSATSSFPPVGSFGASSFGTTVGAGGSFSG